MIEVELWADGSGTNKGPIGFAWTLIHRHTGHVQEGQAGAVQGTNNRAELLAVIHGLEALKRPCSVLVVTDSEYVGKPFPHGWVDIWKGKQWRKVKNRDLWQRLDSVVARHTVTWQWVRGHSGLDHNESCDRRAGRCRRAIIAALTDGDPLSDLPFPVIDKWAPEHQLALEAA